MKLDTLGDSLAAGSQTLRTVIILTVVLTVAFSFLYMNQRKKST
jgi:hypothetical protein